MEEAVPYCIHFPEIRLRQKKEKTLFGELSIRLSDLADSLKTDSLVGLRNVHISVHISKA